jgi:hypothetical protein
MRHAMPMRVRLSKCPQFCPQLKPKDPSSGSGGRDLGRTYVSGAMNAFRWLGVGLGPAPRGVWSKEWWAQWSASAQRPGTEAAVEIAHKFAVDVVMATHRQHDGSPRSPLTIRSLHPMKRPDTVMLVRSGRRPDPQRRQVHRLLLPAHLPPCPRLQSVLATRCGRSSPSQLPRGARNAHRRGSPPARGLRGHADGNSRERAPTQPRQIFCQRTPQPFGDAPHRPCPYSRRCSTAREGWHGRSPRRGELGHRRSGE